MIPWKIRKDMCFLQVGEKECVMVKLAGILKRFLRKMGMEKNSMNFTKEFR